MRYEILRYTVIILGLIMVMYHLVFSQYLLQNVTQHLIFHLGFGLLIVFSTALRKSGRYWAIKTAFILISLFCFVYLRVFSDWLELYGMYNATNFDLAIGILLIILCLEATRRSFGLVLPGLALAFILYAFVGPYLPGPLHTMSINWKILLETLTVGFASSGVFGPILKVSANYIFLFMVFAALMRSVGAVKWFDEVGKFVSRRFRSGPGMAAMISSGLVGSVSGQAGANVLITGSYTIPAMKAAGYSPEQAGGIEAAASTGGPIIPPVMGVAAFLMSGMTGISYGKIIGIAVFPALLYLFSGVLYAQFQAAKIGITATVEKVDYHELIFRAPLFLVPLIVIIVLFMQGKTPLYVSFWAVIVILFVSLLRKQTRPSLRGLVNGLVEGASIGSSIAVTCGTLGIIVGIITKTGLGVSLTSAIGDLAGHNLLLILIFAAVSSIILGIGMPASAAYITVAIVIAPALVDLGVSLIAAHYFTFFFANFSYLTPPVALAALFSAQLADANFMKTAIESTKVGLAGFVLPFMIVLSKPLIWDFSGSLFSVVSNVADCVVIFIGLQAALVGYFMTKLTIIERLMFFAGPLLLLIHLYTQAAAYFGLGIAVLGVSFLEQILKQKLGVRS